MTVHLCDRCGDVTVDDHPCRCAAPCDPMAVQRRHRTAVTRARHTDDLLARAREARPAA